MRYSTLGRTGIKVSPYALGAMMFGAIGNPDHDDSVRIIHKALDAGINVVDTAEVYSDGESEEIVGKALRGRRDSVVLATKVRPRALVATPDAGDDPNRRGNSRRWIMTAVENSLRRLQTDYIDLYQIHRPDPDTDIEETLSALSDLIHAGKVRAIGSSAMPAADIVEAQWVAERRGLERSAPSSRPRCAWRRTSPAGHRYRDARSVPSIAGQAATPHPRRSGPTDRPPWRSRGLRGEQAAFLRQGVSVDLPEAPCYHAHRQQVGRIGQVVQSLLN